MPMTRVLIVVNAEWYFWSHRLALARALRARGFAVVIAAGVERDRRASIEADGFRFLPLRLSRRSTAPWTELRTLFGLYQLYRRERPDVVHHIAIKPVLYGSLAAKLAGVPAIINTVPGLGYMFVGRGIAGTLRRWLATLMYRLALAGERTRVILQNPDDAARFISARIAVPSHTIVIRGSGVDTDLFVPAPEPTDGPPIVVLASRLLWDKGVGELVEASRLLKADGIACRVVLVGVPDEENPNSITNQQLQAWHEEGVIEWWGLRDDMPDILRRAAVVALPSYYPEGVPKFLLEAAASARPIVTTDAPGCREAVEHERSGLLVPVRDAVALAHALARLLRDPQLRARMGAVARELAVHEFSDRIVAARHMVVYDQLLERVRARRACVPQDA